MRVLVTGDRNWTNKDRIREVLSALDDFGCIIEGGARGADTLAREVAKELGVPHCPRGDAGGLPGPYMADWDKFHKAAGPIRNRLMVSDGKPNLVVAFHNDILESKGTLDMVRFARSKKIPTYIYTEVGVFVGEV